MSAHISSVRTYVTIFLCLLAATALTVLAAFHDFGALSNVVALGIAIFKATLVILFFMHVRYSTRMTGLVVLSGALWLFFLFALTMADYLTRVFVPVQAAAGM